MEKLYDQYARSVGLTYSSLSILEIIYDTPVNCTQKLICEEMHYPKQSVNLIIKSFLEQGYIEMKEIKSDRRNKALRLSKSGRVYADKVIGNLTRAEDAAIEGLTSEERQTFIEIMRKMEHGFREKIELECAP